MSMTPANLLLYLGACKEASLTDKVGIALEKKIVKLNLDGQEVLTLVMLFGGMKGKRWVSIPPNISNSR